MTEAERIASGRDWFGYLTLENFDAVAARVKALLEGKRYTWVSCNEGLRDFFPEVRTGQEMEKLVIHDRSDLGEGATMAHFTVCDSYGVWGLDSTVADQRGAEQKRRAAWDAADAAARRRGAEGRGLTYVHFTRGRYDQGRIEIQHHNGFGDRLYWVVSVEPEHGEGE